MANEYKIVRQLVGDRFEDFISKLDDSSIIFLYLTASTSTPYVKFNLKTYNDHHTGENAYICKSVNKDGVYVYKESAIKYLLTYDTSTLQVDNFQLDPNNGNAFQGDHLTFIAKLTTNDEILITSHKTDYTFDPSTYSLIRDPPTYCNFNIPKHDFVTSSNVLDFKNLKKQTLCSVKRNDPHPTLLDDLQMRETDKRTLFTLYEISMGKKPTFAGGKVKRYYFYNKRKYLVRKTEKGREYLLSQGKKVFIDKLKKTETQKGGATIEIDFNVEFLNFIRRKVIMPLHMTMKGDYEETFILYDKNSDPSKKMYLSFIINYGEIYTDIIRIEVKNIFAAFYLDSINNEQVVELVMKEDAMEFNKQIQKYLDKF